jgi:threonine dehydrogenase-like Zn-dependent dehydrogenase
MNLAPLVIDEVTVVGSRCGPFKPALKALERGTIAVKHLVSEVYSFGMAPSAFVHAREKGVVKVLLDFRQE